MAVTNYIGVITINKEPTYYIIRSLAMMNYLVRQGHDVVKVQDSDRNSKYKMFMFHDSDKLRRDMENYKRQGV